MTPEEQRKLEDVHDTVLSLRPMLVGVAENMKALEPRLHFLEVRVGQLDVRAEHAEESYNGLANKLRRLDSIVRGPIGKFRNSASLEDEIGIWLRIVNFAAENKALTLGVLLSGGGTLACIYNLIVSWLHRLPLIPR